MKLRFFLLYSIIFLVINTSNSQEIRINKDNYQKYLSLDQFEIDTNLKNQLMWTEHLVDTLEYERGLDIVKNEFLVKEKWVKDILLVNNEYIINNDLLSLAFLKFKITNDKVAKKMLERENNKKYKNFRYLALTEYFLIQDNNNFLVIFSETSINPIISGMFAN